MDVLATHRLQLGEITFQRTDERIQRLDQAPLAGVLPVSAPQMREKRQQPQVIDVGFVEVRLPPEQNHLAGGELRIARPWHPAQSWKIRQDFEAGMEFVKIEAEALKKHLALRQCDLRIGQLALRRREGLGYAFPDRLPLLRF